VLIVFAILPFFSTLLGGTAAIRLRHRLHPFMAFAAGILVATAMADLFPEATTLIGPDVNPVVPGAAAVLGFLIFSALEAFVHRETWEHEHQRVASQFEPTDPHEHVPSAPPPSNSALSVLGPISLITHSTLDGLAIGLAFRAGSEVGLLVGLAVLAHDFADGMNVVTLALEAARGERLAVVLLVLDALAPPAGAALSFLVTLPAMGLGLLLASVAGVFLAVGAGHLLPESQHDDPRRGPALVALSGAGAAFVLVIRALAG
jgi:zinc transporter ZupT